MTISLLEIRTKIADKLGADIGTYYLPKGGKKIPAIAVLPDPNLGYAYPPETTRTQGLEIVIMHGDVDLQNYLSHQVKKTEAITIFLKQWDITKTTLLAADAIAPLFDHLRSPIRKVASEPTQCEITILTVGGWCVLS